MGTSFSRVSQQPQRVGTSRPSAFSTLQLSSTHPRLFSLEPIRSHASLLCAPGALGDTLPPWRYAWERVASHRPSEELILLSKKTSNSIIRLVMTAPSVRCPQCSTSFRITRAQVLAAEGAVRCGSCLVVFNARPAFEGLLEKQGVSQTPPASDKKIHSDPSFQANPQTSDEEDSSFPGSHALRGNPHLPSHSTTVADTPTQSLGISQHSTDSQQHSSSIRKKGKKWLLISTITLLAILLVMQFFWFQRDRLALNPWLRPAYQSLCEIASCTLPIQTDIQAIKSVQLLVRSHPTTDNALIVDTLIINQANHPQPWPSLHLAFSDLNDHPVASRTFSPKEYLGGELSQSKEMPAGQPVRLSLEIVDPGEEAVNYQLSFSDYLF